MQTAERDHVYEALDSECRAILHWLARQALKTLGMPAEEHVHQAALPEPALKLSIRMAQQALDLESPAEAVVHFKRALGYYEGAQQPIEILLGYAASLMSLGNWSAAQAALDSLKNAPDLSLRDEVTLLIYQGELNYRVGEVATLFAFMSKPRISCACLARTKNTPAKKSASYTHRPWRASNAVRSKWHVL